MRLKINIKISMVLALLLFGFLGTKVYAQASNATAAISGVVSDEFGKPLVGVVIQTENGKNVTTTDFDGSFTITPTDGSGNIIFSYLGYADQKVSITGATTVNAEMEVDAHRLDEVIQMGYTTQKRKAVSGAVATVTGEELAKAPVANLGLALTGRLPGLFTWETNSEPSRTSSSLISRGISSGTNDVGSQAPLVVVDGIPFQYNANQLYEYINPSEIESVSLLKDASVTAIYGLQSRNGVLVITTKRGHSGPIKIETRFDQSLQQVTTRPHFYNSWEYALLRNEAARNDGIYGEDGYGLFSKYTVDQFYAGNNELYPNNNWYDMFFRDFATMSRAGVSASGGNDIVRYYSEVNFMHQGGQFKTDNDTYKSGPNSNWFNFRSNLDMNLNKYLTGYVRLSGNIKRERTPAGAFGASSYDLYQRLFYMNPTIYGPLTPNGDVVSSEKDDNPIYGTLNRTGYIRHTVTNISAQTGLDLDMSFLTPGLSMGGMFSFQTNSVGGMTTSQDYRRFRRTADEQNPDTWDILEFVRGAGEYSPLSFGKGSSYYYIINGSGHIDYERQFGKHSVTGMGYAFYQTLSQSDTGNTSNAFPFKRVNTGIQATYGYDDRYFVKFDLGYSASDMLSRDTRWVTTPSVSAAWLASNEEFLKDSEWLSLLKVRGSYGATAWDRINGLSRYSYLDKATFSTAGVISSLDNYLITEGLIGNPSLTAEKTIKQNYGIDLGLFNIVTVSVDYFREKLDNMLIQGTANVPYYQGVPFVNYPQENGGKFESEGLEIVASFTKDINRDWTVFGGGSFNYNKNKVIYKAETPQAANSAYLYQSEGYPVGQAWGYLSEGYWNSYQEIEESGLDPDTPYEFAAVRPGDLKYRDMNHDGIISIADKVPIGNGQMPNVFYTFNAGAKYKAFELSVLFQGVGEWEMPIMGSGVTETMGTGLYGQLHANAWTKERYEAGAKITYPALSLQPTASNNQTSDFFLYNRSYLRLKNLELAYTLPEKIARAISAERIRVTLSGQNLLTWDKMKTSDFGPEAAGYLTLPVYRVYNIGVNLVF